MTQRDVADRLGLKVTYGRNFTAHFENGLIPNPSLRTVLDYLRICGIRRLNFLDAIDFKSLWQNCQHRSIPIQRKGRLDQPKGRLNWNSKDKV